MKFKFINKDNIARLPKDPGIYAFQKGAKLLYIGKATNLRERVKNHFYPHTITRTCVKDTNKRSMSLFGVGVKQTAFRDNLFINQATKVGYIKTDSDIEALILEAKLIKKYKPKYNIVWRDDKNYFYVGITKEDFPMVFITHQPAKIFTKQKFRRASPKINYVGPFVEGRALKQTLNTLRRVFPFRTCKPYSGKPCLWYQLARCPGPCLLGSKLAKEIPKIEVTIKKESQKNAENLKKILEGGKNQVLKDLKKEMKMASKIRDFEKAAKIRDQIRALERVLSHTRLLETIEPEKNDWDKTKKELKRILNLKKVVSRIEAYDVSNIQGKYATGSMVTFIDGKPDKNFYRRFKIKMEDKPNDVAMIKEILSRRFSHHEWRLPDLILIDGGAAQLSAARQTKNRERKVKNIKVVSLAKRKNELFVEGQKESVLLKKLPREIFNLILQLRDEAHRFAISYHKRLRDTIG